MLINETAKYNLHTIAMAEQFSNKCVLRVLDLVEHSTFNVQWYMLSRRVFRWWRQDGMGAATRT